MYTEKENVGTSLILDKLANSLRDEFGESLVEEEDGEDDPYNWWLSDVTVSDITDFLKGYRGHKNFNWDGLANSLKDEFGESLVEEEDGEDDPYNWWLSDVTVSDITDFLKGYGDL